jgi:hypothetical protein
MLEWVILTITILFHDHVIGDTTTTARLTASCGLYADDQPTITLCARDTNLIFIECDVAGGIFLDWEFQPLGSTVSFTVRNDVGEVILRPPISLTLTSRVSNDGVATFKSQFRAFSNQLRSTLLQLQRTSVEVSCVASSSVKDTISLIVQGELCFDTVLFMP